MRNLSLSLLAATLVAGTSVAQVGPFVARKFAASKIFTQTQMAKQGMYVTTPSRKYLAQIGMAPKVGATSKDEYTVCLTLYDLAAKYGGGTAGMDYVVMGTYNRGKATFTPSTAGNKMNAASGGNFGLMLDGRMGNYAVVDHGDGVYFSYRANPIAAFPAAKKITNWPTGKSYVDPALAWIDGVLHLIYVETISGKQSIVQQKLTVNTTANTAALSGSATVLVSPATTGEQLHSPAPVAAKNGEMVALWFASLVGQSDSDMMFLPSTDTVKRVPYTKVYDTTGWKNNGGVTGATFHCANSGATSGFYGNTDDGDLVWMTANNPKVGQQARLMSFARNNNLPKPAVHLFLWGSSLLTTPIALPGFNGKLAVNPIIVSSAVAVQSDDLGLQQFNVPNDPQLAGVVVPMQSLVFIPGAPATWSFSNQAQLHIR